MAVIMTVVVGCVTLPDHYISLQNQTSLTFQEVLHEIQRERVIFIGEGHDRDQDHLVQLAIIRHLHESGKTVAIALEMFPAEMQTVLNQWITGALSEGDFKRAYHAVWNVPYRYYSEIFEYARKEQIPLVGINGSETLINAVARTGIDQLSEEVRKTIGFSSCAKAREYEMMIRLLQSGGAHMTELPFLCDAELLRDTLMAYNIGGVLGRC